MSDLEKAHAKVTAHQKTVAASHVLSQTLSALPNAGLTTIRCLALGSPALEHQALYQLAFLVELASALKIPHKSIYLYDPCFTEVDQQLFLSLEMQVAETHTSDSEGTLYYMPHAPRTVTESLITTHEPKWLLGNDLTVTMGTLSKTVFFTEFPALAHLVHLTSDSPKAPDDFVPVQRRRRAKKLVYVEPQLDYDISKYYFDKVTVTRIASPGDAPWKAAFSDLALNVISKGETLPAKETTCEEPEAESTRSTEAHVPQPLLAT